MSNPVSAAATGLPAPPPSLPDLIEREQHRARFEAIVAHLIGSLDQPEILTLPMSGLRLIAVRPGAFLFEGVRSHD